MSRYESLLTPPSPSLTFTVKNVYALLGRAFPGSGLAGECRVNSRRRVRGLVINFRR